MNTKDKTPLSFRLYRSLSGADDGDAAEARHFLTILLAQWLTKIGDALVNPKITLPWILSTLGVPAAFSGWLVPLRESGSLLPQVVIAAWVRRVAVRKWLWVLGSVLQAVSVLGLLVVVIWLEGTAAGWSVLGLLVLFSLARGVCSVASKDVMGKLVGKPRRGALTGTSASLAGLVTLGLAGLVWFLPQQQSVFVTGLALAAGLWLLGAAIYGRLAEPASDVDSQPVSFRAIWQPLGHITRDRLLLRFVVARTLMLCSALSAPFYVILAQGQENSGLELLALLMAASGLAGMISGNIWGRMANHSSRHVLLLASAMVAACGLLIALIDSVRPGWLGLVGVMPVMYFLLSLAHEGVRTGRKTYLVNMADGNQRTDYVSASNTLIGVMLLVLGSVGSLAGVISVAGVILVLAVLGLAGVGMAWTLPEVEEPEEDHD